ncbi:MAG: hypothetical protein QXZ47_05880 [Candidatus Bathyarchaeia archaeon]
MEVEEILEAPFGESSGQQEPEQTPQEAAKEEQLETKQKEQSRLDANNQRDRSSFIHGLSVGLGLGCISTFIIIWVVVFFTPQIPTLTYESMLSMFIYPMLYLLAVGLVALTAGIVREYYTRK